VIKEFDERIDQLKREYHAFVRKLKEYDPSSKIVPWTERAYSSENKRKLDTGRSLIVSTLRTIMVLL